MFGYELITEVEDQWIFTRRIKNQGVIVYFGKPQWFGKVYEVGKVRYDRAERVRSFEEQLEIVIERAKQQAQVHVNHKAGLV